MENVSRDNLISQLNFMLGEIKRRPKDAYFAIPEFFVAQIDKDWMKQVSKSTIARQLKLQKEAEKRASKIKPKKDNV